MATDEKPTPLPPTLTEAQLERFVSLLTQGVLEMKRNARLLAANQQLDARAQMRQVDATERIEKQVARMARILGDRPNTLTVVQDVPTREREDVTQTVFLGQPWWSVTIGSKRIPSKWVARGFGIIVVILCVVMLLAGMGLDRMGVKPREVVRAAAPLVAP